MIKQTIKYLSLSLLFIIFSINISYAEDILEGFQTSKVTNNTGSLDNKVSDSLKLISVNTLNLREIELNFNFAINDNSTKDFKIVNKNDEFDEFLIEKTTVNKNSIILVLDRALTKGNEYNVNIIILEGVNNEIIKSGIDGSKNFFVDLSVSDYNGFPSYYNGDIIIKGSDTTLPEGDTALSQIDTTLSEGDNIELESAGEDPNIGGVNSANIIDNTNLIKKTEDLPQTGPESWIIMFILASLISVFFYKNYYNKKQS